jgi:hypothetical protein
MTSHRRTCGVRLFWAEKAGRILTLRDGLTPAGARREMSCAGITESRGYPADQVQVYAADRPGKGRWGQK